MKHIKIGVLFLILSFPVAAAAQSVPYTQLPQGGSPLYGGGYQPQQNQGHQYRTPSGLGSLPTLNSPARQSGVQTLEQRLHALRQQQIQRQQALQNALREMRQRAQQHNPSDPYGTQPYTRGFRMPEWKVKELERGNRALDKNYYFQTGCHKYSRACLNELKSLGR